MSGPGRDSALAFRVQEVYALYKAFKDIPNVLRKGRNLSDGNIYNIRNALTVEGIDLERAETIRKHYQEYLALHIICISVCNLGHFARCQLCIRDA
jgi:hypothetical protein